MTDEPTKSNGAPSEQPAPEKRERKIPKVEPVFGKRGWMIVLLPFIIYYIGSSLTSYLDNSRAFTYVHEQQHKVVGLMRMALFEIATELQPEKRQEIQQADTLAVFKFNEEMEAALARLNWNELDRLAKLPEELFADDLETASQSFINADEELQDLMRPSTYETTKEEIEFLVKLLKLQEDGLKRQVLAEYYAKEHEGDEGEVIEQNRARFLSFQPDRTWYPSLYTLNIIISTIVLFVVFPFYFRAPFKITYWSVVLGVAGIVVWVGLWWVKNHLLGLGDFQKGSRAAFNPFVELADNKQWMWMFMGVRFWGLVIVVPFLEEFFLRGWLMRYIDHPDWDTVPLGLVTKLSGPGIAIYAAASHPETLAAVVWFSMGTWLYWKTKSIWDCVVFHIITNLLLGLFVLKTGIWQLW